jgi:hypothetical protein
MSSKKCADEVLNIFCGEKQEHCGRSKLCEIQANRYEKSGKRNKRNEYFYTELCND